MSDDPHESAGWRGRLSGWAQRAEREARELAERAEREARELAGRADSSLRELQTQAWFRAAQQAGSKAADDLRAFGQRIAENEAVQEARARLEQSPLWLETQRASERIRDSEAWQQLETSAERAAESARSVARSAGERLEQVQRELEGLFGAIENAARDPSDRAAVIEGAADAFARVGGQFDLLADGVAVGFLQEAGAGVASVQGTELFFVPPDGPVRGQLRVSRIVGQSARLAVGGQIGGYVAAFYGERERLVRPLDRRGADLGLLVASLGFFRGSDATAGWLFELAAGASLGIPFLSDFSAFELEEVSLASYALTSEESERFEQALAEAPDRPTRRQIAQMLRAPAQEPS